MDEEGAGAGVPNRFPLAKVVAGCAKRWFMETLKEARAGDTAMQMLVAQMYSSGYGVQKDAHKGRAWMNKARKNQSLACEVSDKPRVIDAPHGR